MPPTWLKFDLRSDGFQSLFTVLGGGAAQYQRELQLLLDSPWGDLFGVVAVEPDITQMFARHPLPVLAIVMVTELPQGATAEEVIETLVTSVDRYPMVSDLDIESKRINNLPAVRLNYQVDLSELEYPVLAQVEQVGLLANQKVYLLTFVVRQENADRRESTIQQVIGTFRPE